MAVTKRLYGALWQSFKRAVARLNALGNRTMPLGNPGFAIDTNFDVQNANAIDYIIAGVLYTLAANTTADTGTSASLAADTWGVGLITVDAAGDLTITWKTNSGSGYSTEAAAIAALTQDDIPASECVLGYLTVLTASGAAWDAGTDALQGGTGGDPSADTNYYNDSNPNGIVNPNFEFATGAPTEDLTA